jgi:hypothetical protein
MKSLISVTVFTSLSFILSSCQKNDTGSIIKPPAPELSTVCQVSVTDEQVNEGILMAMDAADGTEDNSADLRPLSCAVVSSDPVAKTITVDFGTGCLNPISGEMRSGRIIIGYTGDSYATATQRTFHFDSFRSFDSTTLSGTFTQTEITRSTNSISFRLNTSDFIFYLKGSKRHTISSYDRHFSVNLGSNLRDLSDNITSISGSVAGINKEQNPYSITTITPVIFNGSCSANRIFYPTTGSCDVRIGIEPKFNISWGGGNCDKIITISFLGSAVDVALK